MTCEHDYDWRDAPDDIEPCDVHVDCDERCKALVRPETPEELRAALEHWRCHQWLSGCSHGR
jgi:hypothetical protein